MFTLRVMKCERHNPVLYPLFGFLFFHSVMTKRRRRQREISAAHFKRRCFAHFAHDVEEGESGDDDKDEEGSDDAGYNARSTGSTERGRVNERVVDVDGHYHGGGSSVVGRQTTVIA